MVLDPFSYSNQACVQHICFVQLILLWQYHAQLCPSEERGPGKADPPCWVSRVYSLPPSLRTNSCLRRIHGTRRDAEENRQARHQLRCFITLVNKATIPQQTPFYNQSLHVTYTFPCAFCRKVSLILQRASPCKPNQGFPRFTHTNDTCGSSNKDRWLFTACHRSRNAHTHPALTDTGNNAPTSTDLQALKEQISCYHKILIPFKFCRRSGYISWKNKRIKKEYSHSTLSRSF